MVRSVLALTLLMFIAACDSGSSDTEAPTYYQIQMQYDNLPGLKEGVQYQVWARQNGEWISVDKFNLDSQGRFVDTSGRLVANTLIADFDLAPSTEFMISIEDRRDTDEFPSDTRVLQGPVNGSEASLTFAAAGLNLGTVSATYTVATPNDDDPSNEAFGVWLGAPGTWTPTMTAPTLGDNWRYELWIELSSGPVSMGKFAAPDGFDDNAPFSDQAETYAVPGESFLRDGLAGETFPLAVAGHEIYVTLEPNPDDFGEPFGIRLLEANIPAGAPTGQALPMTAVTTRPTGVIRLR